MSRSVGAFRPWEDVSRDGHDVGLFYRDPFFFFGSVVFRGSFAHFGLAYDRNPGACSRRFVSPQRRPPKEKN